MLEPSSREGMRVRPGASAPSLSSDPSASRPSDPGAPALPRRPSALGSAPRRLGGLQGRLPGSLRGVEDADLKPSGSRCQSRCGLSPKGRARWRGGGRTRHAARSEALEAAGGPLRSHVFLGNLGKKMQQKKGGQKGSEGPALGREAPHPTPHRKKLGAGIGSKGGDSPGAGHRGCHHGKGRLGTAPPWVCWEDSSPRKHRVVTCCATSLGHTVLRGARQVLPVTVKFLKLLRHRGTSIITCRVPLARCVLAFVNGGQGGGGPAGRAPSVPGPRVCRSSRWRWGRAAVSL